MFLYLFILLYILGNIAKHPWTIIWIERYIGNILLLNVWYLYMTYHAAHEANGKGTEHPSLAMHVPLELVRQLYDGDRHDDTIGWVDKTG